MHHHQRLQSEFEHLAAHVERMWRRLAAGSLAGARFVPGSLEPPVDVYQDDGQVVVVLEMAGIRDQRVLLELEGRRLTIRGERRGEPCEAGNRVYAQMEILCGPFHRTVELPAAVDPDRLAAAYDDGFLRLTFPVLPAAEPPRPVRVQVTRSELRAM